MRLVLRYNGPLELTAGAAIDLGDGVTGNYVTVSGGLGILVYEVVE